MVVEDAVAEDAVSELLSEKEGPENQNLKIPPKKSPCWVQSAPN